jgi:hypothetical protein
MTNDFISMIAAAVLAVIFVFIANHLSKKFRGHKLPKWVMPTAAGFAMLGYTIYAEYAWFPNIEARLPEGVQIAHRVESKMIYRPWTFAFPLTTRFIALDRARREDEFARADIVLVARWGRPVQLPVVFNCVTSQRADLIEDASFEDGELRGGGWRDIDPEDPVLQTACKEG